MERGKKKIKGEIKSLERRARAVKKWGEKEGKRWERKARRESEV